MSGLTKNAQKHWYIYVVEVFCTNPFLGVNLPLKMDEWF